MAFIIITSVFVITIYILIMVYLQEWSLPGWNIETFIGNRDKYKVLIIYPHPDDETMASGGLAVKLAQNKKVDLTCVSLTHGERGDEILKLEPEELAKIRSKEFDTATARLGIKKQELWNFADGQVKKQASKLKQKLKSYLDEQRFDLVITYERSGLYGHPDHIILSRIISELAMELKHFKALYTTISRNLAKNIKLPVHMCEEEDRKITMGRAEYKIGIAPYLVHKYRAACAYKSQVLNANAPLILEMLLLPYEYYSSSYED